MANIPEFHIGVRPSSDAARSGCFTTQTAKSSTNSGQLLRPKTGQGLPGINSMHLGFALLN